MAWLAMAAVFVPTASAEEYEIEADTTAWMVAGPAPTLGRQPGQQTVGWVDALLRVNDALLIGGDFQGVKPSSDGPITARPFLAAFDAETGVNIDSFHGPSEVDAVVRSLVLAPAGDRVYVAGDFGVVAIDPATGSLDPGFEATVMDDGLPGRIWDMKIVGDDLYIAGDFTAVNGAPLTNIARLSLDGVVDPAWSVEVSGGRSNAIYAPVQALDVSSDGTTMYVGGTFTHLNGTSVPKHGPTGARKNISLLAVSTADGSVSTERFLPDAGSSSKAFVVHDILVTPNEVIIAWGGPNALSFHAADGGRIHQYFGAGDFQSLAVIDDQLFVGHHGEYIGSWLDPIPAEAVTSLSPFTTAPHKLNTMRLDGATYPVEQSFRINGAMGIWALAASEDDLWVGGHISRAGSQLFATEGVARFTNLYSDAPELGLVGSIAPVGDGVSWRLGGEPSPASGITKVSWWIDGRYQAFDTAAPFTKVVDLGDLTGTHELTLRGIDANGTVLIQTEPISFDIGEAEATIALAAAATPAANGVSTTLSADSPADSGITKVSWWIDGEYQVSDGSAPFTKTVHLGDLTGEHELFVRGLDATGTVLVQTDPIMIDFSAEPAPAPEVTVTAVRRSVGTKWRLGADVAADAGITKVSWWIDGEYQLADNTAPFTRVADLGGYTGQRELVARAFGSDGVLVVETPPIILDFDA